MKYLSHSVSLPNDHYLIALHMFSDASIAVSYLLIPAFLLILTLRVRQSASFRRLLLRRCMRLNALSTAFLLACGSEHLLGVLTSIYPAYCAEGWLKLVTAIIGCATVVSVGRVACYDDRNS